MDIRTLLTETKSFPTKRKADSPRQELIPSSSLPVFSSPTDNSSKTFVAPAANQSKNVKFTLSNSSRSLNLTVSPTDPPSAITSTVKDFFALHNCGVSFTDTNGNILIITPNNLTDNMEVIVNQTSSVTEDANHVKKKRKSMLSSRKKTTKKIIVEAEIVEEQDDEAQKEKRERIFSSDVSIDNILDSSRRRLSKFSSQNLPLLPPASKPTRTSPPKRTFPTQLLPTPTPTSASVISDEDVAIQLMRLTDPLATPLLSPTIIEEPETPIEKPETPIEKPEDKVESKTDEEEHSRCTRCIATKKGCDRKRPCSRCVQQGFEEWECTSDDEKGSARKRVAALRRSTKMGRTVARARGAK